MRFAVHCLCMLVFFYRLFRLAVARKPLSYPHFDHRLATRMDLHLDAPGGNPLLASDMDDICQPYKEIVFFTGPSGAACLSYPQQ